MQALPPFAKSEKPNLKENCQDLAMRWIMVHVVKLIKQANHCSVVALMSWWLHEQTQT